METRSIKLSTNCSRTNLKCHMKFGDHLMLKVGDLCAHCAKHGGQRSTVIGETVEVSQIRQFAEDNPVIGGQRFNSVLFT